MTCGGRCGSLRSTCAGCWCLALLVGTRPGRWPEIGYRALSLPLTGADRPPEELPQDSRPDRTGRLQRAPGARRGLGALAGWVHTPAHGSLHQALAGSGQGRAVGRLSDAAEGRGHYQLGKRFDLISSLPGRLGGLRDWAIAGRRQIGVSVADRDAPSMTVLMGTSLFVLK
jgi:hypothetical protein